MLDALVEIQRQQDPTLAFRYACRVGMCGSCAMVVDGRERWACRTRLAALGAGEITVRPLYHFPLLRDLVVDMATFDRGMSTVDAVFRPAPDAAQYALIPRDAPERRDIDPAIECIGCGMCVSACTMVAHNPRFPGPAALNRAFTLQRDSRDAGDRSRWRVLLDGPEGQQHDRAGIARECLRLAMRAVGEADHPRGRRPNRRRVAIWRRRMIEVVGARACGQTSVQLPWP